MMPSPTLRTMMENRVQTAPGKVFVVYDDLGGTVTSRTYAQFDEDTNQASHLLRDLGIRRGDSLTLVLGNCLEFLTVWFGAAKIGAVIVPVNTASSPDELRYLVDHSESRLIVSEGRWADTARAVAHDCPRVESVLVCGTDVPTSTTGFTRLCSTRPVTPPPDDGPSATDEAALLYTSGTTAKPKGVVVTHANYIYAGHTVARATELGSDDRHLVVLPLFHGNAQYYSTMSALVAGASLALMSRFSASRYFEQAITHRCTVSSLFAAPIRMILAQNLRPEFSSNPLRVVLFAQNVTPDQLDDWKRRFSTPLLQLWGMTETMGPPIMNPLRGEQRNMSMGRTVPGYTTQLVNEDGHPVSPGQTGHLIVQGIAGQTVMKAYHKNPTATVDTLRNGWLWSGDTARQDQDGYYYFVDRAKDMIKRAGENVAASEVEAAILAHPGVFDCAVIGVPDSIRDEAILAVVVPRGDTLTEPEVIAWCRHRLASFRVPQRIRFRTQLPRTAVGKIQKHILRTAFTTDEH